jgi:hypothetical protein
MKGLVNKKGQLTIFIIIAILIIAVIAVIFFFRPEPNTQGGSPEVSPVYTKTLSCLESTAEDGIFYIALRGGYYNIPEQVSVNYLEEETCYYYIDSAKKIPSMEVINSELEKYISENLKYCIDFKSLKEQGFNVEEGDLDINIEINKDEVIVNADYPLTITKGEEVSRFGEFSTDIPVDINKMYLASGEIVSSYSERPGLVCLTCLDDISNKYNVNIKATPISDKNFIWFSVLDSESDLKWRFVVEK